MTIKEISKEEALSRLKPNQSLKCVQCIASVGRPLGGQLILKISKG